MPHVRVKVYTLALTVIAVQVQVLHCIHLQPCCTTGVCVHVYTSADTLYHFRFIAHVYFSNISEEYMCRFVLVTIAAYIIILRLLMNATQMYRSESWWTLLSSVLQLSLRYV